MSLPKILTPRIAIFALFAVSLIPFSAAAQSGPAGNWTGTYTSSLTLTGCQNKTFTSSGNASVTFVVTGTSLLGRLDRTGVQVFSGTCTPTVQEVAQSFVGTVSGNSVTWSFPNDPNSTQYAGSITGDSLNAQISNDIGGTGSITLARTPSAPSTPPAVDLTGSWSGTYSLSDKCSNGASKSYTGAATLGLNQSGNIPVGVITLQNVPLYDQNCNTITLLNTSLTASGVVSGPTFSGVAFDPSGSFDFPFTAALTDNTISGTVAGASTTSTAGTFTLTRSSAAPPATDLAGTYGGSYTEVDNESQFCINVGLLQFNGAASLAVVQAGDNLSGAIIFQDTEDVGSDGVGDCVILGSGQEVLPLAGVRSGNTLAETIPIGGSAAAQISVMFSGSAATGTILDSYGDFASFDAAKTAAAFAPIVSSFKAESPSIAVGQTTTLSWSTSNATSVSIDHGVGTQPANGSVNVSPTTTTTYTLTATGANGSATATTTITVFVPGARQRIVHG